MSPVTMPPGRAYDPTFGQPYLVAQKYGVGGSQGTSLIVYFYPNNPPNYWDPQGNQVTVATAIAAGFKGDGVE